MTYIHKPICPWIKTRSWQFKSC